MTRDIITTVSLRAEVQPQNFYLHLGGLGGLAVKTCPKVLAVALAVAARLDPMPRNLHPTRRMSGRLRRRRVPLWFALFQCALAVVTACKTKEQKRLEGYEVKKQEAIPVVKALQEQLRALQTDLGRDPPRAETSCDANSVTRAFGSATVIPTPLFGDEAFLRAMVAPKHDWRWSEDELFAAYPFGFGTERAVSLVASLRKFSREHSGDAFVVFVVTEDRRPTMIGGDPATWGTKTIPKSAFHPGILKAWAVAYDMRRRQRLCQVHVQATSSETVAYVAGRPSNALFKDYIRRVHAAAEESLARADPRLRPSFVPVQP